MLVLLRWGDALRQLVAADAAPGIQACNGCSAGISGFWNADLPTPISSALPLGNVFASGIVKWQKGSKRHVADAASGTGSSDP
jgi:hypothetical protein